MMPSNSLLAFIFTFHNPLVLDSLNAANRWKASVESNLFPVEPIQRRTEFLLTVAVCLAGIFSGDSENNNRVRFVHNFLNS